MIPMSGTKPPDVNKSWKKINEERKAIKKQRKQEKLLKELKKKQDMDVEKESAEQESNVKTVEKKINPSTISIAVPGSILENAQSIELRTYVAGQIARAACIFRVSEVIVFDDIGLATARETKRNYDVDNNNAAEGTSQTVRSSCLQLARILQYLECPQYLRKFFFPLHKDLKYSGLLNPLDAPHHLRQQNVFRYREGIVTEKQAKQGHSYVNVGLLNDVLVNTSLTAGLRVTVKLDSAHDNVRKQRGTIVSPDEPRSETGVYWGYSVRIAHSISDIFTKSPYKGGYDLTVGTSDRGANVHELPSQSLKFNHILFVFGGLQGLEGAVSSDDKLQVDDPTLLFDQYINVLPKQGSRTIRTEEAILIALAAMQEKLNPETKDVNEEIIKDALPRSEDTGGIIPRPGMTKMLKKRKHVEETTDDINEMLQTKEQQPDIAAETPAVSDPPIKKDKQTRKNPFKTASDKQTKRNPFKNANNSQVSLENSREINNDHIDMEVVPVGKTDLKATTMSDIDLSRFD